MQENLYTPHSIRTFTGKYFDYTVMDPDTIDIRDIAHALSNMPRFSGHTPQFYSVAQHCVRAAIYAPDEVKLEALLHDATEAYLLDVAKPLKALLPDYQKLELQLFYVINKKFGLIEPAHPSIKKIDAELLEDEFRNVVLWDGLAPFPGWDHRLAEITFLKYYEAYKRV